MRVGDNILNYTVTRRLKAGGMGVVFEGEQNWGSRRKVAIKQLLEQHRDDDHVRKRFIREAEILELLDDPRIVKILGFDHEQDAFVMEFIDGKTLSDRLKQDAHAFRQPAVLVAFLRNLLDAFAYAHDVVLSMNGRTEQGIVHRDIKPSNIIVQPDGTPKILDFGISRIASFQSTLTDPKLQMGSVPYMSPEQIATPTDVDWRSDIYSLGVTCWEMMTGRSPYPKVTTHEVVVEVQRQIRLEPLPSIVDAIPDKQAGEEPFLRRIDQFIAKATAKDRAYRFQHCNEMKAALEQMYAEWLNAETEPANQLARVEAADEPTQLQPASPVLPSASHEPVPMVSGADTNSVPQQATAPVGPQTPEPKPVLGGNASVAEQPSQMWMVYAALVVVLVGVGLLWWYRNTKTTEVSVAAGAVSSPIATEATMATLATADSCYEVANRYYHGQNGTAKDLNQAAYWYGKAATLGNSDAQSRLGTMYQYGQGVGKDYQQAVKWFRASAGQGNAEGQKNLGYMYYIGLGTSKDYPAAMKWFRAAAEQGNAEGSANLGIMYEQGMGVPENNREALKWYMRSANQNYPRAQYYVGTMYAWGRGIEQNQSKALQWYRLAAKQGDSSAQQELRRLGETW